MFSKSVSTIFRVLGEALLSLAAMPVTDDRATDVLIGNARTLTGSEYINELDKPDAGAELPNVTTGAAAQVFGVPNVTEVFASPTKPVTFVLSDIQAVPVTYKMTEKAGAFTREQYHASDWTDETLIADGYMVIVQQDTRPNVPPAAASGSPPAPSAPATASTTVAAPAAQAPSDVPAPAGSATHLDSNGLPWDGRIHSSSREVNADGGWKKKRGATPADVARVTSELLAAVAQVKTPFTPLAASAQAPAAPAPAAPPAPAAAAAPAPAAAPPAPATVGTGDSPRTKFADFCKWLTTNGLSMGQASDVARPYGIMAMGLLAHADNVEILGVVYDEMAAKLAA